MTFKFQLQSIEDSVSIVCVVTYSVSAEHLWKYKHAYMKLKLNFEIVKDHSSSWGAQKNFITHRSSEYKSKGLPEEISSLSSYSMSSLFMKSLSRGIWHAAMKNNSAMKLNSRRSLSLDFQPLQEDPFNETAHSALAKSGFLRIDWKIDENKTVYDAIVIMSAQKIGALAVTSGGEVVGVISERDYLNKIGVLGRTSKTTLVSEIATMGKSNLVSVTLQNPIEACMTKMINHNVRHLLVREKESGKIVGMMSMKDIIKCVIAKHEAVVDKLYTHIVVKEITEKGF